MERKEFLRAIQACRRKLNRAQFWKLLVFALSIGAGVGILFQAAAFVVPFYYANHYTVAAVLLGIVTALVMACIKKRTMEQAALVMDSFGFKERIVTAYEHLNDEGEMVRLQRADAMKHLKMYKDRIKIPMLPPRKSMLWMTGLLMVLCLLIILPSEMKDKAQVLHQVKQEAKEKEEEIEEVVEDLEELAMEELSPEQLAALQEMIESMQSSMEEYGQATSPEELSDATEKLEYKYENMGSQLNSLAQSLQNGAQASAMTAQAMQNMAEQLQNMSGNQSLASNQNQNGNQNGQGNQNGNQSGQGNQSGSQNGNQNGQGDQNNGQNSNNQSGDGQNGQGDQNNQGNNGQNGQNGNNQNGQGGGQNGQGSGQGGQNGQGSGSGDGNGSGNGQGGNGDGSGNGRGTGSSDTPHDYVSVPNAIADSGNLTGNAQNHDNSDFFKAQNGLSWEGTHMSHEAVIGSYEQNAYEGIAAGQYPSGMEDVIKEYFASFN